MLLDGLMYAYGVKKSLYRQIKEIVYDKRHDLFALNLSVFLAEGFIFVSRWIRLSGNFKKKNTEIINRYIHIYAAKKTIFF